MKWEGCFHVFYLPLVKNVFMSSPRLYVVAVVCIPSSDIYSVCLLKWSEVAQSCPTLCDPWTVAHQALLSMGFSRQKYWSELPFPSPGDLPNPGIEPRSPALEADTLTSEPPGNMQQWISTEISFQFFLHHLQARWWLFTKVLSEILPLVILDPTPSRLGSYSELLLLSQAGKW